MKKLKIIAIWVAIALYLFVSLNFTRKKHSEIVCSKIEVVLTDSITSGSFERSPLLARIQGENSNLIGIPVDSINAAALEEKINMNPFIKHAEIYKTVKGVVRIEIRQRVPIIRIIDKHNSSFYLDAEGVLMPNSDKYISRVLVANGNIEIAESDSLIENRVMINSMPPENAKLLNRKLCELYTLSLYIDKNKFWKSQIEQVYVTQEGEFELIPKVGNHIIVFGTLTDYKVKFDKLSAFYEKALKAYKLNQYKIINLKFKDQVICTYR